MTQRLGRHSCEEDMIAARKEKNNRVKKITYWKEQYGVEVNDEQYEMFSLHSNKIKN